MRTKTQIVGILAYGLAWLAWSQNPPSELAPAVDLPSNSTLETGSSTDRPTQPETVPMSAGGGNFFPRMVNWTTQNHQGIGPVSVTVFSEPDQRKLAEISEDLSVLSFLIERNLERSFASDAGDYKLGIPMLLTSAGHSVEAAYIQGFGAIFNMEVRFPLVAPLGSNEQARAAKQGSEWDEARRALLSRPANEVEYSTAGWTRGQSPYSDYHVDQVYNGKLVETLKRRVLNLLKNGSNLRHLGDDEWIIVKITGAPNPVAPASGVERADSGTDRIEGRDPNQEARNNGTFGSTAKTPMPTDGKGQPTRDMTKDARFGTGTSAHTRIFITNIIVASSSGPTVMTLRVKKSAADAFATGKTSEDQFLNQAEVTSYFDPGSISGAQVIESASQKR